MASTSPTWRGIRDVSPGGGEKEDTATTQWSCDMEGPGEGGGRKIVETSWVFEGKEERKRERKQIKDLRAKRRLPPPLNTFPLYGGTSFDIHNIFSSLGFVLDFRHVVRSLSSPVGSLISQGAFSLQVSLLIHTPNSINAILSSSTTCEPSFPPVLIASLSCGVNSSRHKCHERGWKRSSERCH